MDKLSLKSMRCAASLKAAAHATLLLLMPRPWAARTTLRMQSVVSTPPGGVAAKGGLSTAVGGAV